MFNAWYESQTSEPPMLKNCVKNRNNAYDIKSYIMIYNHTIKEEGISR